MVLQSSFIKYLSAEIFLQRSFTKRIASVMERNSNDQINEIFVKASAKMGLSSRNAPTCDFSIHFWNELITIWILAENLN